MIVALVIQAGALLVMCGLVRLLMLSLVRWINLQCRQDVPRRILLFWSVNVRESKLVRSRLEIIDVIRSGYALEGKISYSTCPS